MAALSTALLIAAWAVAVVTHPAAAPAPQAAAYNTTAIPDVRIDGLSIPVASTTPAPSRGPLGTVAVSSVASSLPPSQIPSAAYLAYRRSAEVLASTKTSCHLQWPLLAAIAKIESDHGRYGGNTLDAHGVSRPGIYGVALDGGARTAAIRDTDQGRWDHDKVWDRAVGPMQIIPSTWAVIAVDADHDGVEDPQDIDDAALAAGVYLCAGGEDLGTQAGVRAAVHGYNHSDAYVAQVMALEQAYANGEKVAIAPLPAAPGTVGEPGRSTAADAEHTGKKDRPARADEQKLDDHDGATAVKHHPRTRGPASPAEKDDPGTPPTPRAPQPKPTAPAAGTSEPAPTAATPGAPGSTPATPKAPEPQSHPTSEPSASQATPPPSTSPPPTSDTPTSDTPTSDTPTRQHEGGTQAGQSGDDTKADQ
ncbi:MAG: lytic murein transglycosylase, partial [Nocardioidaceae bacterium]